MQFTRLKQPHIHFLSTFIFFLNIATTNLSNMEVSVLSIVSCLRILQQKKSIIIEIWKFVHLSYTVPHTSTIHKYANVPSVVHDFIPFWTDRGRQNNFAVILINFTNLNLAVWTNSKFASMICPLSRQFIRNSWHGFTIFLWCFLI